MNKLGKYIKQVRGVTYNPKDISEISLQDYLPILKANNIQDNSLDTSNLIYIHKSKIKEEQLIRKGDLLLAASSGSKDIVGKNVFFESDFNGSFGAFCKVVRPNENIYPKFLSVFFKTPAYKRHIRKLIQGANINNLRNEDIDSLRIPEFTANEQIQIAELLSNAYDLLRQRKESILLLDKFLKSSFLEMFGDPITNPNGFPIRKLSEFYISPKEGTKCGPFGSALKKEEFVPNGIPVWNMDNITSNGQFVDDSYLWISPNKFEELKNYHTRNGDIIISRAGTVGKMCVIDSKYEHSIISTNLIRLRLSDELLPLYFTSLMLYCKGRVGRLKTGADGAFTHMNTGVLDNLQFPYPPPSLQSNYKELHQRIRNIEVHYKEGLQELENLYGSLSQQAFNKVLKFKSTKKLEDFEPKEIELTEEELGMNGEKDKLVPVKPPVALDASQEKVKEVYKKEKDIDFSFESNTPLVDIFEMKQEDLYPFINKHFKDNYFTFENLKQAAIKASWDYDFETLKNYVFELLRKGNLKQVFADAAFKTQFTDQHPDFKRVKDLAEQMYLQRVVTL